MSHKGVTVNFYVKPTVVRDISIVLLSSPSNLSVHRPSHHYYGPVKKCPRKVNVELFPCVSWLQPRL